MSEQNKPREFFIADSCILTETGQEFRVAGTFPNGTITGKYIHVIEYSAFQAEREKVRRLTELVSKILKAKRSATMYLANPCDKNEHYPSIYISYEVESWFQKLEKEIEDL